ncbi:MAG TPA: DUF4194 domain-containing protein [Nevskiaceae bacterium]|nr:DUF4194 domain-containing protein [Nevskiaceae bacterium]
MQTDLSDTPPDLSILLINLLKGVQYREQDEPRWAALLNLQTRVRDYVAVLNLELVLDEAEGYAFLKGAAVAVEKSSGAPLPRLVARRPLSYPVSLMLALLRKRLAEFDAGGGDTRLIMPRDEIVDSLRIFLRDASNEARLVDQTDATINKVVELGFLRKLKTAGGNTAGPAHYEVRRILKAFVDAQWLADFDARLAQYQSLQTDAVATPSEANDE